MLEPVMPVEHSLPFGRNLLITTSNSIHLRTSAGDKTIFECASADGIVNACAAPDNSSLLAIADSHGVLMHDTAQPRNKKHKLKDSSDTPRLLCFSPDSRALFFNTKLNNSIHVYSLPTGDLLNTPHSHPSPPSVLAISRNGNFLLTASSSPPTVLIQGRWRDGVALAEFKPPNTSSAVTCAAFDTFVGSADPSSIRFVLGFRDGTLALYRMAVPSPSQSQASMRYDQLFDNRLQPVSVGAISKLHKATMGGVATAAFIPGHMSRVVSAGFDGRCRLVDFASGGQKLRTWHVSSPATSLSLTVTSRDRQDGSVLFQGGAADDQQTTCKESETLIAVGTEAGKVLVYDVLGLLVSEIVMDEPVRAVEWVGDMSAPSTLPTRKSPLSLEPGPVIKKLIEEVGEIEGLPPQSTRIAEDGLTETGNLSRLEAIKKPRVLFSTTIPHHDLPSQSPYGLHYLNKEVNPVAQPLQVKAHDMMLPETMMSGALPVSRQPPRTVDLATDSDSDNGSVVRVRRQLRVKKAATASLRQPRRVRASTSSCCSMRRSASSSQDFFTPPSTRFPSVCKARGDTEAAHRTNESQTAVKEKRNQPLCIASGRSSLLSEDDQGNMEQLAARRTGRHPAKAKLSRPAAAAVGIRVRSASSRANAPSSLRSVSRSYDSIPASGPELNQLAYQGNVAKRSRATSEKRKLVEVSPAPDIVGRSSQDFSSSLYSRPKSRAFRNHSKALDGGADAATPPQSPTSAPERNFNFKAGLHEIEALAEQQCVVAKRSEAWTGGKRSEISRLRTDHEALRKQFSSLREDFKTLKDVLLQAETHQRWEACVS